MSVKTVKMSFLKLVHSPISTQEAVWIKRSKSTSAQEQLQQSDFYMIGGRMEAKLDDVQFDGNTNILTVTITIGDQIKRICELHLHKLPFLQEYDGHKVSTSVEDDKYIVFRDSPASNANSKVLAFFSPDSLIWHVSQGMPGVVGLEEVRDLATFDLLYVGIAKVGDSFDRLIKKGHTKRQEILSNEPQRYPGARVTDEIYLFLFKIEPLILRMSTLEDFTFKGDVEYNNKQIVIDAEKAFVSLLRPEYNDVVYTQYPKGKDALYGGQFDSYGYVIAENIAFNTQRCTIRGSWSSITNMTTNDEDGILVSGNKVTFLESGFPKNL
ncbi:MAG: hypothetical protein K2X81_10080 [Candidatus Obscuribacterales bacterium]|nr:hypothetical protein [Candidatus Obscuribacterales bacterium]